MILPINQLPGASFWQRARSRAARRAAKRDFLLRMMPQNGVCIEVGVFDGLFSERILAITRPAKLHLVDPWRPKADGTLFDGPTQQFDGAVQANEALEDQYRSVLARLQEDLASERVVVHRMLSHEAAPLFPDDHFDWAYIDASHYYEDCKNDLEAFFPKVRSGGFITGDDYGRRQFWNHGVTRAVDEFAATFPVDVVLIRRHQYILRKR